MPLSDGQISTAGARLSDGVGLGSVDLDMRLVLLAAIAAAPHSSSHELADATDTHDERELSRLFEQLQHAALIQRSDQGEDGGVAETWTLTSRGAEVARVTRRVYGRLDA